MTSPTSHPTRQTSQTRQSTCRRLAIVAALAWAGATCATGAHALDLLSDYRDAQAHEPTFRTAVAERQSNLASATQARMAYLPEGSLSNQRIESDSSNRQTFTISQPLIHLERLATMRMGEPKEGFAEATFALKQQELATRLFKAANAIILANENLKLNGSKIASLNQQTQAARKKLELGQGTITDLRDIDVKLSQAKAGQLSYQTQLATAVKQYASITGYRPNAAEFVLTQQDRPLQLKPSADYVDMALQSNPALRAARNTERLAALDLSRATASLLPTMAATYSNSKAGGNTTSYTGLVINMPLQSGTYFGRRAVQANYEKSKEAAREVAEQARLATEKLREQVETGQQALLIQKDAISAAELSLAANVKSYEGGVRSTVDILNATQTLFQVNSEYVTLLTGQAENLLALLTQAGLDTVQALSESQNYLFGR